MARPTKYKKEYNEQALKLARLGATDIEMADFFEVSESTFNLWKKKGGLSESLKEGKMLSDAEVSDKLFKRATGYSHEEDDIRVVAGQIVITPTIKHYPPDTTAGIFWLKNRQPDKWRDKKEDESQGGINELAKAMLQMADRLPD